MSCYLAYPVGDGEAVLVDVSRPVGAAAGVQAIDTGEYRWVLLRSRFAVFQTIIK
jgi:hypothetical protein